MKTKKELKRLERENELLIEKLHQKDNELNFLKSQPKIITNKIDLDLQAKYLCLITKYNKLMDSCLSNETEHITYNGKLYSIQTIDYHKDTESADTIDIRAIHIPRQKGLINNLAEPFKNVAEELKNIFFGNEDI